VRFLASLDECNEVEGLVHALQNDDLGVRWEAANLLAKIGEKSLPEILKALRDPKRVGDQRLREAVVHVIHNFSDHALCDQLAHLLATLKGPSADVETMREAHRLQRIFDPGACEEEEGG
jgi:HEAT repeat protein